MRPWPPHLRRYGMQPMDKPLWTFEEISAATGAPLPGGGHAGGEIAAPAMSPRRHSRESGNPFLAPEQALIWIPACAGMTLRPRFHPLLAMRAAFPSIAARSSPAICSSPSRENTPTGINSSRPRLSGARLPQSWRPATRESPLTPALSPWERESGRAR